MSLSQLACVCAVVVCAVAYPYYPDIPELIDYLNNEDTPVGPQEVTQWPVPSVQKELKQVAGIEAGPGDRVYIFHRGSRKWDAATFLPNNTFAHQEDGPIAEKTIIVTDGTTGKQLAAFGANKFYMPHGLSLDPHGNLWLTDVALHQVMRIPKGKEEPDLVLGEAFIQGSDDKHFCKPTDVAVAKNGDFFVADGYCNSRIMKFSKDGTFLKQWGERVGATLTHMSLNVPHSLALVEDKDLICVADREDARVLCYNAGIKDAAKTGEYVNTLIPTNAVGSVYAITYDGTADVMYAVVNPMTNSGHARGYTVTMDGQGVEEWWYDNTQQSLPHDVTVSTSGSDIFVGDIGLLRAVKLHRRDKVWGERQDPM